MATFQFVIPTAARELHLKAKSYYVVETGLPKG